MTQLMIYPPNYRVLCSQLYTADTTALLKDDDGVDISGGGWIVGADVLIASGAVSFATLFDGDAANDMPLLDVQPRTVLNVNVQLTIPRRFQDTVYLACDVPETGSSRVLVYYIQP